MDMESVYAEHTFENVCICCNELKYKEIHQVYTLSSNTTPWHRSMCTFRTFQSETVCIFIYNYYKYMITRVHLQLFEWERLLRVKS